MSSKTSFKAPKVVPNVVPNVIPNAVPKIPGIETTTPFISKVTKFLPIICAGAAVGVSILTLKEMKKLQSELIAVKTQNHTKEDHVEKEQLSKKLAQFEEQLKRINGYLANNNPKDRKIIKNAMKVPANVNIINQPEPANAEFDKNEYEEIEVTDSEGEESQEES
jgi:hypothetical protein